MGRTLYKLKDAKVRVRTLAPGHYADGGGLYLQVTEGGAKSWAFRYQRNGKRRELGLGATHTVSLAVAREKAAALRAMLVEGRDPYAERRAARAAERGTISFREAAEAYIAAHEAGWRNAKHADQWRNTLATYAFLTIGGLTVGTIDTAHILKVLEPIWTQKPETAKRVRGRMESVLDWATVRGYRVGENPARWRGHLDHLLAKPSKIRRVKHFAALPYVELPAFMADLRQQAGVAARALEFCILTATRTGETIVASWSEISGNVWIIPGERTKSGREHRVPLMPEAVKILDSLRTADATQDAFVFPGLKPGKSLSNMAMSAVLERMERTDITVHGFRSCFRDWAAEQTSFSRELAEAALGHVLKDKTEAAYQRGDLLEKRRRLMAAWARYATRPAKTVGEIVAIRRA